MRHGNCSRNKAATRERWQAGVGLTLAAVGLVLGLVNLVICLQRGVGITVLAPVGVGLALVGAVMVLLAPTEDDGEDRS